MIFVDEFVSQFHFSKKAFLPIKTIFLMPS